MASKYLINKSRPGTSTIKREIEADSYLLQEGYFHFYRGERREANKVFSIAQGTVETIELVPEQ